MGTSSGTIGYDVTTELNEFNQPRIRSEIELVKDIILFCLFTKPGQYPSLPFIGLDIESRLYSFYDELDVEDLKTQLIEQCNALGTYFNSGLVDFKKLKYRNQPSLLIHIEGKEVYPEGYMKDYITDFNRYMIGITFNELKQMIVSVNSEGGT